MAAAHAWVRSFRRPPSDVDSIPQPTKEATEGTGGWGTRLQYRRKDGAQGWCGSCVCVLSEEPKPGRNETAWVHMRNCFHKCNRTQVRPATNEEAEGIDTFTSLLPSLTEAVRKGRMRHIADITDEEDPEDDEQMVAEDYFMDVRLGRPDSQLEPKLNEPANSNATSRMPDQKLNAEPEAEASTSAGTDMEIREEGDSSRHTMDVSSDRESMEEPRGTLKRARPGSPGECSCFKN